ncbi:hypothetical protein GOV12_04865 [Candidatus Pacearchaeota archaeon]|nr:hypothetical protein [Candidatus Pacearchaeota archaeon]
MKLLVRKLWFRGNIDEVMNELFKIPQLDEQFDEGYSYAGEIRPRGIMICSGYWPADAILDRLPESETDVNLVLTSLDLKGDYVRIHGKGRDLKAISSNNSYFWGVNNDIFYSNDVDFNSMTFGEIGHSLGLSHHEHDPKNPCEMSHNYHPCADWKSLDDVEFCDDCYSKLPKPTKVRV